MVPNGSLRKGSQLRAAAKVWAHEESGSHGCGRGSGEWGPQWQPECEAQPVAQPCTSPWVVLALWPGLPRLPTLVGKWQASTLPLTYVSAAHLPLPSTPAVSLLGTF